MHIPSIPCCLVRGGTSKGLMFQKEVLPYLNIEEVLPLLLNLMGAPDPYVNQTQGLGGGKSTNNKIGIVAKSKRTDADLDFYFCQIHPHLDVVDISRNCGNFISAVPVFALYKNLVHSQKPKTLLRIFNENTGQMTHTTVESNLDGMVMEGVTTIAGVSGYFSPIHLKFFQVSGSSTGQLFPTGQRQNQIDGVAVSVLDISVSMIIIRASDLLIDAQTPLDKLHHPDMLKHLLQIRLKAMTLMGLGPELQNQSSPKICLVCPPSSNQKGDIKSYYFDPFKLHDSHAVTGGMCLAGACLLPGTVAQEIYGKPRTIQTQEHHVRIEHQAGILKTSIECTPDGADIVSASFIRTASILMDGEAFIYNKA